MPSFNILIIGGGLGGLATAVSLSKSGHHVTVLESTSKLQTIGGGISIPSNSMRCWDHLGLMERLYEAAETKSPERRRIVRYNGEFICEVGKRDGLYGYDNIVLHRGPLQQLLLEAATESGAKVQVNTRIVSIDETGASPVAITKDGQRIEADLIIGADGAKSTIRSLIYPNIQLRSSYNIYRAVISGSTFKSDPEISSLLDHSTVWWGPHRAVVGIPIQNGECYSLECCHPGNTGTAGDWNKKGDVNQMIETFSDFEPLVGKLLQLVKPEDLLVWKLNSLPELESWIFESGKVVLLGDAAHAMLPFSGQGHAMAIEDSVCLSECLARAESTSDIPRALKIYEAIRKPRTKLISDFGESMAHIWQLPNGEEQQKRDDIYRKTPYFATSNWDGKHVDDLPGLPPDPLFFPYLLAHDVVGFKDTYAARCTWFKGNYYLARVTRLLPQFSFENPGKPETQPSSRPNSLR